jgi:hypothetical protein
MTATAAPRRGEDTADPLRAALREAIEAAAEAREALAAHEAAASRAQQLAQEADTKFDTAVADLNKAKDQHAKAVAAHASGGKQSIEGSAAIRAARVAIEAAEDEHESAITALKQLTAQLPAMAMANWQAEADVEVKIEAMLAPVARAVLAEVQKLESALAIRRAALAVMLENDLIHRAPDEIRHFNFRRQCDAVFDDELRQKIIRLSRPPSEADKQIALETATAWRQAREALRLDSAVVLPVIER